MLLMYILIFLIHDVHSRIGDRAFWTCSSHARTMLECQNILNPTMKRRLPIDLLHYPHMVIIGYGMTMHGVPFWECGGTLISDSWVLTAAHCMEDPRKGPPTHLRVGIATFEFDEVEGLLQDRRIAERVPHPEYAPPTKYHDIALLKADYPFILNRDVRIACLPVSDVIDDTEATVIGFGTTSSGANVGSKTLMAVQVDIIDNAVCNKSVKSLINWGQLREGINEDLICAGDYDNGGRDACQGDSGGPLQVMASGIDCVKKFPLHVVIGVASFGNHCGYKKSPGIYTKVSRYIDWIERIVWPSVS